SGRAGVQPRELTGEVRRVLLRSVGVRAGEVVEPGDHTRVSGTGQLGIQGGAHVPDPLGGFDVRECIPGAANRSPVRFPLVSGDVDAWNPDGHVEPPVSALRVPTYRSWSNRNAAEQVMIVPPIGRSIGSLHSTAGTDCSSRASAAPEHPSTGFIRPVRGRSRKRSKNFSTAGNPWRRWTSTR